MDGAPIAAERSPGRWRLMPERGTVSLFELVLLAALHRARRRSDCRRTCRTCVIQTFLWAGLALAWNIAGGYAGPDLVRARRVLRHRRLHVDDPARQLRLTPWIGTVARRPARGRRRGACSR